ncbi:unnamed protein product [Phyllotreta striolata]|uniref:Thymidylate kinase-like domain-containing protein n=1 Tax=Phyllotreta striolata TaxID=444603 RepID=A0A9N9XRX1_PHYSR|nr:unnamed protein product [Phyllotreta striolata]
MTVLGVVVPKRTLILTRILDKAKVLDLNIILKMKTPLLFKTVESILEVLQRPEHKSPVVQELLSIYEDAKEKKEKFDAPGEAKQHPLIIFEGLDGSGKSTTVKLFAKQINAIKWQTPPESISHLRNLLDDDINLRTAFYSLGNYIAALEVQLLLRTSPVVMDRYWHSTASFAIAQAVHDYKGEYEMPAKGNEIYNFPEDLFKPDLVMLLNVTEQIRIQRLSRRTSFTTQELLLKNSDEFRNNVILAYRNMSNPGVVFINANSKPKDVIDNCLVHVNPLLEKN